MQCSSVLNESNLAGKTVVDVGGGYGDLIHAIESSMPTVGQCYCLGDWSYDCVRISTVHRKGRGAGKTLPTHPHQRAHSGRGNRHSQRRNATVRGIPRCKVHALRYRRSGSLARLAERYIADRSLSDKAIDLLDEAGSMVKLEDDGSDDSLPDDFFVVTVMFSST